MNEAAMAALEEKLTSVRNNMESASCTIKMTHFESGLTKISPSVSEKVLFTYLIIFKTKYCDVSVSECLFFFSFCNSKNIFTRFCRRA